VLPVGGATKADRWTADMGAQGAIKPVVKTQLTAGTQHPHRLANRFVRRVEVRHQKRRIDEINTGVR
jgi:hypothetical protein